VKDLELVYVAFDVLYDEDRSVIDRTLRERHEILRNAFKPVRECDDVVQGDGGVFLGPAPTSRGVVRGRIILNVPAASGDPPNPDCFVGASLRDVEDALWARIERQEEGLVLKDLESRWVPGERDKKWVKLKPDYLPTEDLDVVVVGGFKGTGALRGGKIAEYLVGIVEAPRRRGDGDEDGDGDDAFGDDGIRDVGDANSPPPLPSRVLTFSKVGTGMSARARTEGSPSRAVTVTARLTFGLVRSEKTNRRATSATNATNAATRKKVSPRTSRARTCATSLNATTRSKRSTSSSSPRARVSARTSRNARRR
jgi:ATP-dependent DNA ligase